MNRRGFIRVGSVVVVFPILDGLLGCGESTPGTNNTANNMTFTSTSVNAHTHTVQIDVASTAAVDRETSQDAGHTHRVELTAADMTSIAGGGTVTKETTVVTGHTHSFTFKKA